MSIEVQKVEVNEASILYQARTKLSELATEISDARKLSSSHSKIVQATKIRLMLKALDLGEYLTRVQRERIWYMLIEVSEIYDFPTAPILETRTRPDILLGYTISNTYTGVTTLTHNKIFIGNASNVPSEVTPSGDVTITDTGVTAIGANKVTVSMIADAELKAIAGLASSADKIPYFVGVGSASMLNFKDEDDMVSDSPTALPSQQSVKAYVDAQFAGAGTGDVVGPSSSTDNAIARFNLTTGKLIQNSVVTIADTTGNMAGVGTLNTHTIPGGTGTIALTSNITGTNSGTNTGDQTITLTGAVTGTGTGTFATTLASGIDAAKIGDGSVSTAEFQYINSLTSNAQTQITARQALVNTATTLTDAASIDVASIKNTLATSSATRTFTISYTGDDVTIEVILSATSSTFTFPATALCVSEGVASGNNTCALSGTSGDKYIIAIKKIGSAYYVVCKNFGQ